MSVAACCNIYNNIIILAIDCIVFGESDAVISWTAVASKGLNPKTQVIDPR